MKKRANKAERAYMDQVAALGCIICESPAEIHHVRDGMGLGQRAEHIGGVIPLCPRHHRTGGHGVAIHGGIRTFEANFNTEADMLELVALLL